MSFLSAVGKDIKAVFSWLGSSKGQAVIGAAEGVAETIATIAGLGAPVQAGIDLINGWLAEAIKAETIAAGAGSQDGTGAQKSAAVLSAMTPQLLQYLQSQGITSAQVTTTAEAINTAIVNLLNSIPAAGAQASQH